MKRILSLFLSIVMVFSLAACGQRSGTPVTEPAAASSAAVQTAPQEPSGQTADGNILVAYFSWADNAVSADDVNAVTSPSVIPPGKVQQLAGWVQEATGGDLFAIRVTDPYPSDWDACLDRANEERCNDSGQRLRRT